MKKNFQLFTALALCIFGCTMLIAGFCCPPLAEIHHSVLVAFGEILPFSGSLIGIDYKYRYKELFGYCSTGNELPIMSKSKYSS